MKKKEQKKINRNKIVILSMILLFMAVLSYTILQIMAFQDELQKEQTTNQVCFDELCFNVELAMTFGEKSQGLMFRKDMEKESGMLFIYEKEGIYPFWMKNTLINLDMIWIDENKKVVFIHENATPCKNTECIPINPKIKAKYVLEINAGLAQELGIKEGNSAEINFRNSESLK